MEPFIYSVDISDVSQLYGRKRQIEILLSCAKRRGNAGIIGARRFGKTCLLKSMEAYLMSHPEISAYPLYFDVKTQTSSHKNTSEVYRSMAAKLASKMCSDNIIPVGELKISRRCILDVSTDTLDMMEQMTKWSKEYQKQALFSLSDIVGKSGKYVLLMLDEIDYLLMEAFESPADFFRIRGAATDPECNLKFWVAGIAPWKEMCTGVGSPQLNCGLESVTLNPLSKEDSSLLWKHECSLIKEEQIRNALLDLDEEVFHKTGGVPYYVKAIGSHILNTHVYSLPTYQVLRDHLSQLVDNRFMSEIEKSTLYALSEGGKTYKDSIPDAISGLVSKGLVNQNGDTYSIGIGYLVDYIKSCKKDEDSINVEDEDRQELNSLVDEIIRLRIDVNRAYKGSEPFVASVEDPREFNVLKIMCHDDSTMAAFSSSIYKLYYEGSDKGKKLPEHFQFSDFNNMVRALRHMFNHRECELPPNMNEERLLRIVNNGVRPYKSEDFRHMQDIMLKSYHEELLRIISTNSTVTSVDETPLCVKERLVLGTFYKGEYGGKDRVKQDGVFRYQEVRSIRDGDFLQNGNRVEYILCCEPNRNDPTRKFWYAKDVHLIN